MRNGGGDGKDSSGNDIQKMEVLLELSERVPGAITVLSDVIELHKNTPEKLAYVLTSLSVFNIRGSKIWQVYKYDCGGDIQRFSDTVCNLLSEEAENVTESELESEHDDDDDCKNNAQFQSQPQPQPQSQSQSQSPRDEREEMRIIAQIGLDQYLDTSTSKSNIPIKLE